MGGTIIDDLLADLPEGRLLDVRIGMFWSAAVVEVDGERRCGLASNIHQGGHRHGQQTEVDAAGLLLELGARNLAGLARSRSLVEASVGLAAINALLPRQEERYSDLNAEHVIAERGAGKRVVVIGSFPFLERLRDRVGSMAVMDLRPGYGDTPPEAAAELLPQADLVALSGTSLINHTFEGLMKLCSPEAIVMVLGPSTPLSPVLFDRGAHILAGSLVQDEDAVLRAVSQGATFRQMHPLGVRVVTMQR
jgi:uncharacterized protein (DUF4213/DUF364 family)